MYKVGIIGFGKIGQLRARLVGSHPDLHLDSICDKEVVEQNVLQPFKCLQFEDYREVFDRKPDIIFVCTSNDVISDIAVRALETGCHVFAEKPPGRNMAEVQAIVSASKNNPNLKVKIGFNHRYHDSVMQAYKLIQSKRLGEILSVRGIYGKSGSNDYETQWRNKRTVSGGGILLDQGIHVLDLMLLFCKDFTELKSFVDRKYWNVDVEDNVFAILRNDKQTALLVSSAIQWKHTFNMEVILEEGYICLRGILSGSMTYGRESLIVARKSYEPGRIGNPVEQEFYFDTDLSWEREIDEFVDCIKNNKHINVGTTEDALRVMDLVSRIYRADESWLTPIVETGFKVN